MEIKVGGEWNTSTSEVWLTTSGDCSIEVQHAGVVSRAVIFASSVEGSMFRESMESMALEGVVKVSTGNFVRSLCEGSL